MNCELGPQTFSKTLKKAPAQADTNRSAALNQARLRALLLGSSALLGVGIVFASVPTAYADCQNSGETVQVDNQINLDNGETLTCDDIEVSAPIAAGSGVTITLGDGSNANGGVTQDTSSGDFEDDVAIFVRGDSAVTINADGSVTSAEIGIVASGDGTTVTVNGGTINADDDGILSVLSNDTTVTVNGGTINADDDGIVLVLSNANTVTVNGGTINAGGDGIEVDSGDDNTVTVNGGTINADNNGINVDSGDGNTVTVNGGTINADDDGIYVRGTGSDGNTVTINGGTVTAENNVVEIDAQAGTQTLNLSTDATVSGNFLAFGNGTVNFNLLGTGDSTVEGDIDGFTSLSKQDSGLFRLEGDILNTPEIDISGGTLEINGDASDSAVTVNTGTRLQGEGTVKSADIVNGATLSAGKSSIGTFTVTEELTFEAGSTLEVDLDDTGGVDLVMSEGGISIDGVTIKVLPTWTGGGSLAALVPGAEFTILTASDGVSVDLDDVALDFTHDFAFMDAELISNSDDLVLAFQRNTIGFADLAVTQNQKAAASAAESTGEGNEVFDAVVGISEDQASTLFNFLTGEIHASTQSVLLQDGLGNRIMSQLRGKLTDDGQSQGYIATHGDNPGQSGYSLPSWWQAYGSFLDLDSDGNAVGAQASTGGVIAGAGTTVGYGVHAGLFADFSRTVVKAGDIASTADVDSFSLGAYAGREYGDIRVLGGASYSWSDISTDRMVQAGSLSERLKADYNSHTFQAFAETGYRFENAFAALEPFAGLSHIAVLSDGFTEEGGIASLMSEGQTQSVTYTSLGLRAEKEFQSGSTKGKLDSYVFWQHAFGDTTTHLEQAFVSGGNAFTIQGTPIAEDALVLGLGVELQIADQLSIGLNYGGQFADDTFQNTFSGRLTARF